jgi:hypothetical protein
MKYNSIKLGFTCATVIPVIIFVVFFLIKFHDLGYAYVLKNPLHVKVAPRMFSLCVYPNLLIFYIFLQKNRMLSVRGVLIGTILMALIVLLLYLFL